MDGTRRDALRACGLAAAVGLAGCSGLASDADTGSPTPGTAGTTTATGGDAGGTEPAPRDGTPTPVPDTRGSVGMSCDIGGAYDEYYFRPAVAWVRRGAEVTWAPTSPCRQQTLSYHPDTGYPLRIPEGAEPWSSPVLQGEDGPGFTHTFDVAGVYNYAGLHEEFGQVGIVVVGRPDDLDAEPGMAEPQGAIPDPARERLRALVEDVRELLG